MCFVVLGGFVHEFFTGVDVQLSVNIAGVGAGGVEGNDEFV